MSEESLPPPPVLPDGVAFSPIPSASGYAASSDGAIWSCWAKRGRGYRKGSRYVVGSSWRQLVATPNSQSGYLQVHLGSRRIRSVHRLVLEAFTGRATESQPECRHLDGDKTNNRRDNLAWGTRGENLADRDKHGTTPRGERHRNAKLNTLAVRAIRGLSGQMPKRDIARLFNVSSTTVRDVIGGKVWAHVGASTKRATFRGVSS